VSGLFHLPLSEEALPQFHLFQAMLLNLEQVVGPDVWTVFGNYVSTKASKVYQSLMDLGGTIPALKWMWKGCCQQKHKVFFWLLIHNRLNTRVMMERKNFFMDNYSCTLLDKMSWKLETIYFSMPFC
jgi:hypothetical protein